MITYEQALTARHFEHRTLKNSDGTPLRARRNGQTKVWKREPGAFKIPCKHGLKTCFYIAWNPRIASELDGTGNAPEWEVAP